MQPISLIRYFKLDGESWFVGLLKQKVFSKNIKLGHHWRTILCPTPEICPKCICFVIKQTLYVSRPVANYCIVSFLHWPSANTGKSINKQATGKPLVCTFFASFGHLIKKSLETGHYFCRCLKSFLGLHREVLQINICLLSTVLFCFF